MNEIFICYRRKEEYKDGIPAQPVGSYIARILYESLHRKGFSVVFDKESFKGGFDYIKETPKIINQNVRVFIVVLTKSFFVRCNKMGEDPVFRELDCAIKKYNAERSEEETYYTPYQCKFAIIPIIPDGLFDFKKDFPDDVPAILKETFYGLTAKDIEFAGSDFQEIFDIKLTKEIRTLLSANGIDKINDMPRRRNRAMLDISSKEDSFLSSMFCRIFGLK